MTCMPASRSARATTLMPRSWPSSPTLARTIRRGVGELMRLPGTLSISRFQPAHPGAEGLQDAGLQGGAVEAPDLRDAQGSQDGQAIEKATVIESQTGNGSPLPCTRG